MQLLNLKNNIFVFVLLELVILCKSYSNETAGKILNRPKRHIHRLKITIKEEHMTIKLKLSGTDQRLAARSVPVWHAIPSTAANKDNIELIERFQDFDTLGDFTTYHDIEHSAAFVHFRNRDELYGIIDTRYYVKNLPFPIAETTVHEVNGPYVKKQPPDKARHVRNVDIHDPTEPLNLRETWLELKENIEATNRTKSRVRRSAKFNPKKEHVFLEILVLAGHDTLVDVVGATQLSDNQPYLGFLKYIVAYYNAVDLLYARFWDPTIQLNIAGIVIEKVADVFPFVSRFKIAPDESGRQRLEVGKVLAALTNHFIKFQQNTFTCDSLDAIMLLTKSKLLAKPPDIYVDGVTRWPMDPYDDRKKKICPSYSAVIALRFRNDFQDFICAAHEIGHLLNILGHDKPRPYPKPGESCRLHIMKTVASNCPECLTWSKRSIKAISKYLNTNKYCHLLNYPRSLSRYGPKRLLTRTRLCRCYKSAFSAPTVALENICNTPYTCVSRGVKLLTSHPEPFDGVQCGPNKVCWNKQCQPAVPFIPSLDIFIEETRN